jgi:hypothetical protein
MGMRRGDLNAGAGRPQRPGRMVRTENMEIAMSSKKTGKKSKVVSEAKAAKVTEPKVAKTGESKPAKQAPAKGAATAPKREKPAKAAGPRRVSALDAAAQVLQRKGEPMRSGELISAMAESGLWASPKGKTPHATLYAAILREISVKGRDARFRKVDRGRFEYAKGA